MEASAGGDPSGGVPGSTGGHQASAGEILRTFVIAIDALPDSSIMIFDIDCRYLVVRGGALLEAHITPEDLEGQLAQDVLAPERWQLYAPLYDAALRGETSTVESTSPDGQRQYLVRVAPVLDGGEVVGGVSSAHDVTEKNATLRALADSEARYRLLAENSSDFVLRNTPDGVIEWISPSVIDVLGWTPEELLGTRSLEFTHPDHRSTAREIADQVNAGATITGRIQVTCKDGTSRWMARTVRPLLGEDGELVARVSGWHDVHAEVEAEQALAASEEQFRAALSSAIIGSAICAPDGRFLWVNAAFGRIVGFPREELEQMRWADITHADDVSSGWDRMTSLRAGSLDSFTERKRYLTKSGGVVWGDISVAAVREVDGSLRHQIVQLVDVSTEVANLESLVRSAREFRLLAENASDVVLRIDPAGVIDWVSPSVSTVLGWDPDALVGTPSSAIIDEADRDEVLRQRSDLVASGRDGLEMTVRYRTAWGAAREMSAVVHVLRVDGDDAVTGMAVGLRDVTDEAKVRRELAYRASHDILTGVANRDDLLSRLRTRLEIPSDPGRKVGVLFCDVDNLKSINDVHGHRAGDSVLAAVATRLVGAVRHHDVVARIGGDEFVVVLEQVDDVAQLEAVAEKCRAAVGHVVERSDRPIEVSVSIGGVLAALDEDADDVLGRADRALFQAKNAGRNQVRVDDSSQ